MERRIGLLNRLGLGTTGALALAAGVLLLLLNQGAFGDDTANDRVLDGDVDGWFADRSWIWWPIALAALALAYLGWRWLRTQFRSARPGNDDIQRFTERGWTRIAGGGVTDAIEQDVQALPGVLGASARLNGRGGDAVLDLKVDVDETADLSRVRAGIEDGLIPRLGRALDMAEMQVRTEFALKQRGHQPRVA